MIVNMLKYSVIFFLCTISCKDVTKRKCDVRESQEFTSIMYSNYQKKYFIDSANSEDRVDFVKLYTTHCDIDYKSEYYTIENAINLFDKKKENIFYTELIFFKSPENLNYIIEKIKVKNCIDPYNIKINRIYKLNSQLAIFVNFSDFDINSFERKILLRYKECKIININTP